MLSFLPDLLVSRAPVWAVAALAVVSSAGPAVAAPSVAFASGEVKSNTEMFGQSTGFNQFAGDSGDQPGLTGAIFTRTSGGQGNATSAFSSVSGYARAGALGLDVGAIVGSQAGLFNGAFGQAEGWVSWTDTLVITAPGKSGIGHFNPLLLLSGGILADTFGSGAVNSYASAFSTFSLGGTGLLGGYVVPPASQGQCAAGSSYCSYEFDGDRNFSGGPPNGAYEFGSVVADIAFTYGVAFDIEYWMFAKTFEQVATWNPLGGAADAEGAAHYGGTLKWGGIDAMFAGTGTDNPVTDYTVTSESGFNYRCAYVSPGASSCEPRNEVPEPGIAGLLLLSACAAVVARRRAPSRARVAEASGA